MRFKYKSTLFFIIILIVICVILGISYHFYEKVLSKKSIVVVDGNITINYLNGKKIKDNNDKYEFSVTNNGDEDIYYYIMFEKAKGNDINYKLIGKDNDINVYNKIKNGIVSSYIIIGGNTTQNYELIVDSKDNNDVFAIIKIGVEQKEEKSEIFAEAILNNNSIVDKKTAFTESALENEGLIKTTDDNGISYYFRGNVDNNNVSLANLSWKIVRINGDGSIKLVLNGILDAVSGYNEGSEYSYSNSVIKTNLDAWYSNNISGFNDYIANYKFCNDITIEDETGNYASYNRIMLNNIPNDVCLGTKISSKIGLLTIDEVVMAGASANGNTSYYLYNPDITNAYYTMSGARYDKTSYYPFIINADGTIDTKTAGSTLKGVRPVINIIKNVKVKGEGTIDNPYTLIIDK